MERMHTPGAKARICADVIAKAEALAYLEATATAVLEAKAGAVVCTSSALSEVVACLKAHKGWRYL